MADWTRPDIAPVVGQIGEDLSAPDDSEVDLDTEHPSRLDAARARLLLASRAKQAKKAAKPAKKIVKKLAKKPAKQPAKRPAKKQEKKPANKK